MKCSYCINFIIWFSTIVAAQPADLPIDSLLVQAQQQLDSLQYQKAIDLSQKIITTETSNKNLAQAHAIQGDVYREQGQYDQAIAQYLSLIHI